MWARASTWIAARTYAALALVALCALAPPLAPRLALAAADAEAAPGRTPAGRVAFRSYAADDGLTNLVVTGIAEDGDGARWVATDEGLFRLDGERFVRVKPPSSVVSSHLHAIAAAPTGELCVGTPMELACGRRGKLTRMLVVSVTRMARTPSALWIMTSQGLHVWRGEGAPVRVSGAERPRPLLWADAHGVVIGEGTSLSFSEDGATWRPLTVTLGDGAADGSEGREVRELLRDEGGALWLRTATRVWRVPAGQRVARDMTFNLPPSMDLRFGQTMALSPSGELTLGSSGGLAFFRGDHWQLLDAERGLPTSSAHLVFYDRSGELWVGSVGMHRRLGRGLIERHTSITGLPGESVWAIERTIDRASDRSDAGALLLGTNHCLAEVVSGRWACVAGTQGRVVRSIAAMPDGGVYFGGMPATLHYRAPAAGAAGGAISLVEDLGETHGARQLLAIHADGDGTLWLGTDIGLYFRAPGGVAQAVTAPGGATGRFVSAIVGDGPRLWAAGYEGLRVREGGRWTHVTERNGLRATAVRYLTRRHDGRLCVLYDEGLGVTCFRYGGGELAEVQHIDGAQGLEPLTAYSLGEDSAGRLWLGTGLGLRVISSDPADGVDRFTERDGIAGDDAAAMAFHLDDDGGLWFGSSSGLTHVAAASYRGPVEPPTVRMLALALGGRTVLARGGAGEEEAGAERDGRAGDAGSDERDGGEDLGKRTLHGGFIANHVDPSNVEYQMRLWPLQEGWEPAPSRRVRYEELSPGNYQLEVQARLRGGAWGPVARTAFSIPVAWWQLRWLWAVAGVIGVAAMALLVLAWQRTAMRRRTRALLAQTDASFRAFLASMPELVIVRRRDGAVHLNEAARALFGDESEREGMWLLRQVHPADRERAAELLRGAPLDRRWSTARMEPMGIGRGAEVAPPAPGSSLVELRVRAGEQWRDLEVSHQTVSLGGAPARILVGRDVTEQRGLQAKMLMADRMVSLGTLVAGIGHEINNPLSYVLGNLEVISELAERGDLMANRGDLVGAVHDALDGAARVRTIVQRLGSFSRSSEDVRMAVALGELIEQAVRLTHNELRHRAELVQELEPVPAVLADPGQLTQVIINLLINAAQAIAPGAADRHRISIRTRRSEDLVILEVQDTGSGMDPQVVAHAFDPFFTTKKVGEGTGLGLSICHGIVTSHGGQIAIESQRGRGTTMRISLPVYHGAPKRAATAPVSISPAAVPIASEPEVSEAVPEVVIDTVSTVSGVVPAVGSAGHARPRVLVIDDEPAVGKVLARMLRAECDVVVLTDGEDALRRVARGERFSAIITDVMMPVLTGLELREQLHAIDPEQARRVVFITGGVFNAATAEQIEQLDVPCMTKPVDADALRRAVHAMVTSRANDSQLGGS